MSLNNDDFRNLIIGVLGAFIFFILESIINFFYHLQKKITLEISGQSLSVIFLILFIYIIFYLLQHTDYSK